MINVINVSPFGDKEADVELSDGQYRCTAFMHPLVVSPGEIWLDPLELLFLISLKEVALDDYNPGIRRVGNTYFHEIEGQLDEKGRILVGDFVFDSTDGLLDEFIGLSHVRVKTSRITAWKRR